MVEVGCLLFPFSFHKFGQSAWVATCIWGVRWLVWLESPLPEKVAGGKFDEACDVCRGGGGKSEEAQVGFSHPPLC